MRRPNRERPAANGALRSAGQGDADESTPQLWRDPEPPRHPLDELHTATARRLADQAAALEAVNVGARDKLENAIRRRARSGQPFTSDDLHDDLGDDPLPHDRASMGAAINAAARARLIVEVGYRKSRRPEARGRRVLVWRGAP